jgi:hypothetical protein
VVLGRLGAQLLIQGRTTTQLPGTGLRKAAVIHGDILGNVMLADGHAPTVIGWPLYYRPDGLANAIAATDAVTFRGAPLAMLDDWSSGADWNQLLVRALLYRLGPTCIFAIRDRLKGILVIHVKRVTPVVDAHRLPLLECAVATAPLRSWLLVVAGQATALPQPRRTEGGFGAPTGTGARAG